MASKFKYPNYGYIHTLFFEVMRSHVPGFRKLSMEDQYQLCDMVDKSQQSRHKHNRYEGAASFWYKDVNKRFGRGRFDKINSIAKVFEVSLNWNKDKGETRTYTPSSQTKKALTEYHKKILRAKQQEPGRLIAHTSKVLRKPPPSIASKAINGHTAKNQINAPIEVLTPINTDNLLAYIKALEKIISQHDDPEYTQGDIFFEQPSMPLSDKDIDKIRLRIRFAGRVIGDSCINLHRDRALLHQYVEHGTGRLYARGSINLQTAPMEIKETALTGFYDCDMENCHYALFKQLANKAGYQAKAIEDYLANKEKIRLELVTVINRPKKAIKQCLIAIMYGARKASFSNKAHPPTLVEKLGEVGACKFICLPFIEALFNDVRAGSKAIIKYQVESNRQNFTNAMGYSINREEEPKKIIAHLLQGLEAKILEIAINDQGMNIVLLQHDGFTCRKKIKPKRLGELVKKVRDQLGYEIAFSQDPLQVPEYLFQNKVIPNREMQNSLLESIAYDDFNYLDVS
jgi:hypothetical protein